MGRGDSDYVELQNAFISDMTKANYQHAQAYSDLQKNRTKYMKTVSEPSALGLGLQIATTAGAYAMSPNSIINQPKPTPTSDWGIVADWEKENL